ncbi:MAG: DUF465 domain-containing protein [Rhodospirillales bacterium]|nr:DUF465 domain-containing protein [Rhodospirillales bacterium]
MDDIEALKEKLSDLRAEHRQLDEEITGFMEDRPFEQLKIQRLKKRKLTLKDEIIQIENQLLPDIIA